MINTIFCITNGFSPYSTDTDYNSEIWFIFKHKLTLLLFIIISLFMSCYYLWFKKNGEKIQLSSLQEKSTNKKRE